MKQSVLKSLMRLFAIAANISTRSEDPTHARGIVASYLKVLLKSDENNQYLTMFDYHYKQFKKRKSTYKQKNISLFSVKALMICEQINEELLQTQKVLILLQLLEVHSNVDQITEGELDFIKTVAISFKIDISEFLNCKSFIFNEIDQLQVKEKLLIISNKEIETHKDVKQLVIPNITVELRFLHISATNTYVFKYIGLKDQIFINNRFIHPDKAYVMDRGGAIRSLKFDPIYYSDIVAKYLEGQITHKISLIADNISYQYKNSTNGIKPFSFVAESGNLIGIMGGSGVGKSTLLNLLNGNIKPDEGEILVNGYNIHKEKNELKGIIGYVPQNDLLIEELSVFENLYYNARLCFGKLDLREITDLVHKMLHDIDLYEIKDLKVGSVINKMISGGERKRLNIALELIREPNILFIDEPTTGLSSTDSENVMDLLRELTLKGKLIIVNIHQPSSPIFKLFDRLIVIDKGGYPVYHGNPVEGIIYFKTITGQINATESECFSCGNVEPDAILDTIETREINERGENTKTRRVAPEDWYSLFQKYIKDKFVINREKHTLPANLFNIPGKIKQFLIFSLRNLFTKLNDRQYLLVVFLEAPILAIVLGYFTKYQVRPGEYIFSENVNLPAYLFMSIVVALFIGLMVSSEEIIKDRKIIQREKFLNLSKISYLNSKVLYLFVLSAMQCFLFVIVGNTILEIKGMGFSYWFILFSCACFANVLGLNISAALKSVVSIYITIPLLLVPQLIFSGAIIKFDKIHRSVTSESYVPLIGNLMASRWAYEAITVKQFKDNDYQKEFYNIDRQASIAAYELNYHIQALESKLESCIHFINDPSRVRQVQKDLQVLRNEFIQIAYNTNISEFNIINDLTLDRFNEDVYDKAIGQLLEVLRMTYRSKLDDALIKRDEKIKEVQAKLGDNIDYYKYKTKYFNERLNGLVMNQQEKNKIVEYDGKFIQKTEPIYLYPESNIGRAQLFAPVKKIFGKFYDTYQFNTGMIWLMTLILFVTLHTDLLKKTIILFNFLKRRRISSLERL